MPEELPRRYVTIRRRYDGKQSGPVSAVVWDSVPGRPHEVCSRMSGRSCGSTAETGTCTSSSVKCTLPSKEPAS